ncbi:hypothetical protein [Lysinibacillus xylanilyticus]|uniref:hypothetical protein n=1 Tax=Lysinibacillus xylanilyticus TaxID=582475 RepID=UPI003D03CF70
MAKQMKKYIAVTTASLMAMQLAACGNTETQTVEESSTTSANSNNFTEENKTITAGEDLQSVYDSDMANACDEWKENDDGSFECLDENSPQYAHHFFNGLMYASAGAMIGSAIYKSRNLKNGTDRKGKSRGSTAPRTSENKNTKSNGITTNGSQKTSGTTSGSSNSSNSSNSSKSSTTNSSNSNTSGSKSYSSGKRSYSNSSGSSSNNTNSYSNHSSSSTGKSGFGSGGASRGGSSSS